MTIKITKELHKKLKGVLTAFTKEEFLLQHSNALISKGGWSHPTNVILNTIDIPTMSKILFVGYEIEETFDKRDIPSNFEIKTIKCEYDAIYDKDTGFVYIVYDKNHHKKCYTKYSIEQVIGFLNSGVWKIK